MIIYFATVEEWDRKKNLDSFVSDGFDKEGFIHCCYPNQSLWVLNRHYRDFEKVLLICIDPKLLKGRLVIEDTSDRGEVFPHIYGPINKESIVKIIEIDKADDDTYIKNSELLDLMK